MALVMLEGAARHDADTRAAGDVEGRTLFVNEAANDAGYFVLVGDMLFVGTDLNGIRAAAAAGRWAAPDTS